uniref:Uncharacterized protein n=1 Tax=Solanum lycopersicum TaxID=4081 RepID=A0A3Q7IDF2_SOLLC
MSDNWVVDELSATDLFNELLPTMPWNSLSHGLFVIARINDEGASYTSQEVLKRVPIHPRIVSAIKSAHALGLRVISDANVFFIETI